MAISRPINPILHAKRIKDLRPTQLTLGLREVVQKRAAWRGHADSTQAGEWLGRRVVPVVHGPGDTWWLIDHHHLARALHEEGVEEVLTTTVATLEHLSKKHFFKVLDYFNWLHCYDEHGELKTYEDLPRHVGKMADDPYRSLAGTVRAAGGYAKTTTPYAEFLWADHFRGSIKRAHLDEKWDKAAAKALKLAREKEADYLPGWAGVED
jgi:hypothetical protein